MDEGSRLDVTVLAVGAAVVAGAGAGGEYGTEPDPRFTFANERPATSPRQPPRRQHPRHQHPAPI